jgi:hypothetical protein
VTTTDHSNPPPHSFTRRTLLQAGGTAAIAIALPAHAVGKARRLRRGAHLRRKSYLPLVGQRFSVLQSPVKLRLVAVKDLNKHQSRSNNAFALTFLAPPGVHELGTTPSLRHPALGSFTLFVVAGAPTRRGQTYTAVINRLHA